MASITNYDKHLNIVLSRIPWILLICLSSTRKMQTYMYECFNHVQIQLQIPSVHVQCSYSLGTSHSKILYESMSLTLRRSNSHDGEQMIEMAWEWWKTHASNAVFLYVSLSMSFADRKVWWFSWDTSKNTSISFLKRSINISVTSPEIPSFEFLTTL